MLGAVLAGHGANQLWCMDFKGYFATGDGKRCDPFTITDAHSRYLIRCQIVSRMDRSRQRGISVVVCLLRARDEFLLFSSRIVGNSEVVAFCLDSCQIAQIRSLTGNRYP